VPVNTVSSVTVVPDDRNASLRVVGAEESGLVGSTNYVKGLSQAEKDRIALYLNFDMVG
jgi:Zn-dependent M28 family amino/carboxypeptidase